MIHLTLNQISAYIDAELPEASVELVRLHLSSCMECTERFGHVEEQEEALSRLLVNHPDDAFFAQFAERVLGPVPAPPPASKKPAAVESPTRVTAVAAAASVAAPAPRATSVAAPAPKAPAAATPGPKQPAVAAPEPRRSAFAPAEKEDPFAAASKSPDPTTALNLDHAMAATMAGAAAPPAAPLATPAAAPAPVTPAHAMASPARAPRTPARKGGASRILLPAAALLLVASAVAVVMRPQLVKLPIPEWSAASRSMDAARSADDAPAPTPSTPSATPSAGGSGLLERAAARSAEADRVRTAEAHDDAAVAWEEAIPELQGNPDELTAGRREIAAARYQAWTEGATAARRDAATRAVRAYLLCAPSGAERDRAWTWLAELKR